ncbi:MAG: hypothetical protein JNL58_23725 [Planctomyces sp.]|nr:hypothetical protein [Planctomyces sp.]
MVTRIPVLLHHSPVRLVTKDGTVIAAARPVRKPVRPTSSLHPPTQQHQPGEAQPFHPPVMTLAEATGAPKPATVAVQNPNLLSRDDGRELMEVIRQLATEIEQTQITQKAVFSDVHQLAVELALAATSYLVGRAIDKDMFRVDLLIQQALHKLDADGVVRVRLNPLDHQLLKRLAEQHQTDPSQRSEPVQKPELTQKPELWQGQVEYTEDDTLARGTVRIETARRTLLSEIHTRIDDIRREWMENLDAAAT